MELTDHNRLMCMQGNTEQSIGFGRLSTAVNLTLGQLPVKCERTCMAPFDVQLMLMLNTGAAIARLHSSCRCERASMVPFDVQLMYMLNTDSMTNSYFMITLIWKPV